MLLRTDRDIEYHRVQEWLNYHVHSRKSTYLLLLNTEHNQQVSYHQHIV